jgi:hypothetical protein
VACPADTLGLLLEPIGNGGPRGMIVARKGNRTQLIVRFFLPIARLLSMDPLARKVAARWALRLGTEFPTPEARREYLHEHPHADPANHTVRPRHEKPKEEAPEKQQHEKPKEEAPAPKREGKKLFDAKETEKLPDTSKQPTKDPDKLFQDAHQAFDHQLKWLNHGSGLDKSIGAAVVRADKDAQVDYDKPGPIVVIGPMKTKGRSKEKVDADYGGDWSKLGDVVRASVAVDSFGEIEDVLDKLRKSGLKLARKPKDRFEKPTEAGYRDLLLNVEYPNGHVGELQVHLKPIMKVKSEGHKIYEGVRSIEAKAKKEGRTMLTDEEMKTIEEANKKARSLYEGAWKQATEGKTKLAHEVIPNYDRRVAAEKKYYDYNGVPAYWEGHNFPKLVTPPYHQEHGKERVIYELQKFFESATPISESEFKKMLKG